MVTYIPWGFPIIPEMEIGFMLTLGLNIYIVASDWGWLLLYLLGVWLSSIRSVSFTLFTPLFLLPFVERFRAKEDDPSELK